MIFPWRTDAPIYHFPFATIGLIVVNWLVFALSDQDPKVLEPFMLEYGAGLHPLEWVTSNFIHAGLWHLLGNMIFLWTFGLIVEGKLGWWRFLTLYLGIGIIECAIEQAVTLGLTGRSCGSSSIVFGMMVIALVWAPKNELTCLVFFGIRPFNVDLSILYFGLLFVSWEVALAVFAGTEISSAALHLLGAGVGLVAGVGMLKLDWVDCEGWDLFNVLAGREAEAQYERRGQRDEEEETPVRVDPAGSLRHLAAVAAGGQASAVPALYQRLRIDTRYRTLPQAELVQLISALHEQKAWEDSVPIMVDYLKMHPGKSGRVRLRLGQVILTQQKRPSQALRVLSKIDSDELPENLDATRRQLVARAEQMRDAGALELQTEDW